MTQRMRAPSPLGAGVGLASNLLLAVNLRPVLSFIRLFFFAIVVASIAFIEPAVVAQ